MNSRGFLRASDADREEVVSRLHTAATEGRIGADELEQRVTDALRARTYADLDATVADLPAPRADRRPATRRSGGHWTLETIRANPWLLLFAIPAVSTAAAVLLAAMVVWAVVAVLVLALGGQRRLPQGPWMYTRHRGRIYGPPRRHPRGYSYWA